MKTKTFILAAITSIVVAATMTSAMPSTDAVTKENGLTVINTTTLAQDVEGYNGPTPLKIYIKGNKIEKVVALKNDEGPKFFAKVTQNVLPQWTGMTVKKARTAKIDVATGATYSSKSVIENVKRGLEYYQKKKKQ